MGSFNATCCVTKTDITTGQKCVLFILDNPNVSQLSCGQNVDLLMAESLMGVYFGKYKDCGQLNVCHPSVHDSEIYHPIPYYISNEAWEFGKKLVTHTDFAAYAEHLDTTIKLGKFLLETKDTVKFIPGSKELIVRYSKWNVYGESMKIILILNTFCELNNFNLFDVSRRNRYAGQECNKKEKNQWMKLRQKRINKLK